MVEKAGVVVPEQIEADDRERLRRFWIVTARSWSSRRAASRGAASPSGSTDMDDGGDGRRPRPHDLRPRLVEECVAGEDLRLVVIDYRLVAAARPPPGPGGRRRPVHGARADREAEPPACRCDRRRGVASRSTARRSATWPRPASALTTSPRRAWSCRSARPPTSIPAAPSTTSPTRSIRELADAAIRVAQAIDIPVVGIDFIVRSPQRARLRLHRGQRAPRPRQSRAAADCGALRRSSLPQLDSRRPALRCGRGRRRDRLRMSTLRIDTDYLAARLKRLLAIPSPTGYTDTIVRETCRELGRLGVELRADPPRRHPRLHARRANRSPPAPSSRISIRSARR